MTQVRTCVATARGLFAVGHTRTCRAARSPFSHYATGGGGDAEAESAHVHKWKTHGRMGTPRFRGEGNNGRYFVGE